MANPDGFFSQFQTRERLVNKSLTKKEVTEASTVRYTKVYIDPNLQIKKGQQDD